MKKLFSVLLITSGLVLAPLNIQSAEPAISSEQMEFFESLGKIAEKPEYADIFNSSIQSAADAEKLLQASGIPAKDLAGLSDDEKVFIALEMEMAQKMENDPAFRQKMADFTYEMLEQLPESERQEIEELFGGTMPSKEELLAPFDEIPAAPAKPSPSQPKTTATITKEEVQKLLDALISNLKTIQRSLKQHMIQEGQKDVEELIVLLGKTNHPAIREVYTRAENKELITTLKELKEITTRDIRALQDTLSVNTDSPYNALGLAPFASIAEIDAAYKNLEATYKKTINSSKGDAKKNAEQSFAFVTENYKQLKNAQEKKDIDKRLKDALNQQNALIEKQIQAAKNSSRAVTNAFYNKRLNTQLNQLLQSHAPDAAERKKAAESLQKQQEMQAKRAQSINPTPVASGSRGNKLEPEIVAPKTNVTADQIKKSTSGQVTTSSGSDRAGLGSPVEPEKAKSATGSKGDTSDKKADEKDKKDNKEDGKEKDNAGKDGKKAQPLREIQLTPEMRLGNVDTSMKKMLEKKDDMLNLFADEEITQKLLYNSAIDTSYLKKNEIQDLKKNIEGVKKITDELNTSLKKLDDIIDDMRNQKDVMKSMKDELKVEERKKRFEDTNEFIEKLAKEIEESITKTKNKITTNITDETQRTAAEKALNEALKTLKIDSIKTNTTQIAENVKKITERFKDKDKDKEESA